MDTFKTEIKEDVREFLQWSHDLSAMDTLTGEGSAHDAQGAFNGAMTFQPWIQANHRQPPYSA